jgi:hypothetical protein
MAESNATFAWLVETGDAIEHGRLSGAVRSYQCGDFALPSGKREVLHGDKTAKAHGQMLDPKQRVVCFCHQP